MNRLGQFIFWLGAFGGAVLLGAHAIDAVAHEDDGPLELVVEAPAMEGDLAGDAAAYFAALDAEISQQQGPLNVTQTADRMERIYAERLEGWAEARLDAGYGDALARVFRFDFPGGAGVGVLREPEGFDDPNFNGATTTDVTDMMRVSLIAEAGGGARITTYRFDGRKLAAASAYVNSIKIDAEDTSP